jgi:hypothetical protein
MHATIRTKRKKERPVLDPIQLETSLQSSSIAYCDVFSENKEIEELGRRLKLSLRNLSR